MRIGRSRQKGERPRSPAAAQATRPGRARARCSVRGPSVCPRLLKGGEGASGRVSAAAIVSQLYPQIKKEKRGRKKSQPQHSHHSHLQPSCAYYYFRNNLFNKNTCVSSPSPASWGPRPVLIIISIIKTIGGPGSPRLPFPASTCSGPALPPGRGAAGWGCVPVTRAGRKGRPRRRRQEEGGRRRCRGPRDQPEGHSEVPAPPPRPGLGVRSRPYTMGSEQSGAGRVGKREGQGLQRAEFPGWGGRRRGGMVSLHQGRSRYSGRGRRAAALGGEEKAAGGAFNQHPPVRPTQHWRKKRARWG
ncbi:uncharacterized protein LOC134740128 [Pongo pygmaeus]|uniref:uncharacterized protein LOC134740128 n=1 Tax=Pongo pygmaeus TaxID=9600 RepID=UPI00300BFC61